MVAETTGELMPKLEISYSDLCQLVGKNIPKEKLEEVLMYAKCEVEEIKGDSIAVENKDTNRPDLWSAEGISREIQGRFGNKKGLPEYSVKKSNIVVEVDKKNEKIRPYTVCAVAKNVEITENVLSQLIQLQEKITITFGRNRKEVALGVYDLDRIKPPIKFTTVKPEGIKFVPLDFEEKMTPAEILEKHPKGKEYGNLLRELPEYPIFIDSRGEVLSLPPIINSNYSGKVTEKTKNLFIECSGFNLKFLVPALNVFVCALADRKAEIESVEIVYPDKRIVLPDLSPKKFSVGVDLVNKTLGLKLSQQQIVELLEKARYKARVVGKVVEVFYPAYRNDLMHPVDVVEDAIISYGYHNIKPEIPKIRTKGKIQEIEEFSERVAEKLIGTGFQEILSYTLTNKRNLFEKMKLKEGKVIEFDNPVSLNWNVFRNWLLPSLLEFLSNNKHVAYPQRIFEIGNCTLIYLKAETKTKDLRKLSCSVSDSKVVYSDIVAVLDPLMKFLKKGYKLKRTEHSSFIEGRCADVLVGNKNVGIIGEINPEVLENWNLEMPVAAFEINLENLI